MPELRLGALWLLSVSSVETFCLDIIWNSNQAVGLVETDMFETDWVGNNINKELILYSCNRKSKTALSCSLSV